MRHYRRLAVAAFCTALLAACNGSSSLTGSTSTTNSSSSSNNNGGVSVGSTGTTTPSNPTTPGGGVVAQPFELSTSGLNTGESVTVSLNGGTSQSVSQNGITIFFAPGFGLATGASYTVTIAAQPPGQVCTLQNASGVFVAGYAIPSITCVDAVSSPSKLLSSSMKITTSRDAPTPRSGAATWNLSGTVWIFGGQRSGASGSEQLNDFWEFNAATHAWTKVTVAYASDAAGNPELPAPRSSAATWVDVHGNLWLFGGLGAGDSAEPALLNDLWEFIPATGEWLRAAPSVLPAATAPQPRMSAASWVDAMGNLWLFGGTTSTPAGEPLALADLWRYNPEAQSWAVGGDP